MVGTKYQKLTQLNGRANCSLQNDHVAESVSCKQILQQEVELEIGNTVNINWQYTSCKTWIITTMYLDLCSWSPEIH